MNRIAALRGPGEAPAVKVCGLTDPDQAVACAAAGAWGIGLVFAPASARFVDERLGREIAAALPAHVARVGVFVNPDANAVADLAREVGLTHVQVHGRFDLEALRATTGLPLIEGVRVAGAPALARADASRADLVLLDAAVAGTHGGTGTTFDWSLVERHRIARSFGVAGGLRSANVGEVIRRLRPALVDVSSGVESAPGQKDPARIAEFFAAVGRAADSR